MANDLVLDGDASSNALAGVRVLVCRAARQQSELSRRIRSHGGIPVEAPVLLIEEGDRDQMRDAARHLASGTFVGVCLTSPNGVTALLAACEAEQIEPSSAIRAAIVACVGSGTARKLREKFGVTPTFVPARATTQALGESFPAGTGRVLLPRADIANPVLDELLVCKGYEPVAVTAYRTKAPSQLPTDVLSALERGDIDLLAFGSSSTVRNFVQLTQDVSWRGQVVSIGPVTSQTCRDAGIDVVAEASPHDLDGLIAALIEAKHHGGHG
ncbi:MAG: uroporphyrinogen-III synthase [Nitriliruptoraceae bacterium]